MRVDWCKCRRGFVSRILTHTHTRVKPLKTNLEHLECSRQPHIQGPGRAKKRTHNTKNVFVFV